MKQAGGKRSLTRKWKQELFAATADSLHHQQFGFPERICLTDLALHLALCHLSGLLCLLLKCTAVAQCLLCSRCMLVPRVKAALLGFQKCGQPWLPSHHLTECRKQLLWVSAH